MDINFTISRYYRSDKYILTCEVHPRNNITLNLNNISFKSDLKSIIAYPVLDRNEKSNFEGRIIEMKDDRIVHFILEGLNDSNISKSDTIFVDLTGFIDECGDLPNLKIIVTPCMKESSEKQNENIVLCK